MLSTPLQTPAPFVLLNSCSISQIERVCGFFDRCLSSVSWIFPFSCWLVDPSRSWVDAVSDFCAGQSPVLQIWLSYASIFTNATLCPALNASFASGNLKTNIGFVPFPRNRQTSMHLLSLGGSSMGIPRTSANAQLAKAFLLYVSSLAFQTLWAEQGGLTFRKSVAGSPDFVYDMNLAHLREPNLVFSQSFPLTSRRVNMAGASRLETIKAYYYSRALLGVSFNDLVYCCILFLRIAFLLILSRFSLFLLLFIQMR
jgi:hypothetical protein